MQILNKWLERNIQPLAALPHPMFDYEGPGDSCRLNRAEISRSVLRSRMHFVTHVPLDEITLEVAVEHFHRGHRLNNVSNISFVATLKSFVLIQLSDSSF